MADTPKRPPEWENWTREIPFDQADFPLAFKDPISDKDKAAMAAARKREQSLAQRGVVLLTPTFPELFKGKE